MRRKEDGFRYVIFTTKHHDWFCLYDSKCSDYKADANADVFRIATDWL